MVITNNRTKVVVGVHLSKEKKGRLYNTCHELLSKKLIVKRSRFHASYIISSHPVAILATSHLVGCIEYWNNSFEDKVDKSAVTTSYQVGWVDYTLQDILGQKFRQYIIQNAKKHAMEIQVWNPYTCVRLRGSLKPDQSQLP